MHPDQLLDASGQLDRSSLYFERFGVTAEALRKVLGAALSRGATDCDLYFEHSRLTSLQLRDRKVNAAGTSVDLGLGVRARVGDQVGYAYTEDLSLKAMVGAARTAAEIARSTPGHAPVDLKQLGLPGYYPVKRRWADAGLDARVPLVRAWEERAFGKDERVKNVQVYLVDAEKVVMVVRADGRIAQDFSPCAAPS